MFDGGGVEDEVGKATVEVAFSAMVGGVEMDLLMANLEKRRAGE